MSSEPLSPADRASLTAERGPVNMNVGAALLFDAGPGLEYAAMLDRLASRLHLVPRFRQRLEESASGLANPVWIDDVHFNLSWHLRTGVLPSPGGPAQLGAYVANEMSRRMDRTRPLWELHIITGLADGRVAILPKLHHAMVDGIAAIAIGTLILDPTPEPLEIPPPAEADWTPKEYDRTERLTRLARAPLRSAQELALQASTRVLYTTPQAAANDLRRATDLVTELARSRPQAPMTPLNRPITPNRAFAMEQVPLAAIKAAAELAGATVNDALLDVVAGMLRRYLDEAGEVPDSDPVALVPVSVRADVDGDGGNQISTVFVDLPTTEDDPIERLRTIAESTRKLKRSAAVRAGALMVGATGMAPPLVSAWLGRAMGGVRAFNLVVSNVPGPQFPLYLGGSQMRGIYPVVPLNPANQGLTVGILSYDGEVHIGLLADGDLDPGIDRVAAALRAALAEMLELSAA